jgi:hypothetical protein
MNKSNLEKIANLIEGIPPKYFNMFNFIHQEYIGDKIITVGNTIGHATILDVYNIQKNFKPKGVVDYLSWSEYFTGLSAESEEWEWCFSPKWVKYDNTPTGAAKRIKILIENGLPENWKHNLNNK